MSTQLYRTNISQAFWCSPGIDRAKLEPAQISLTENQQADTVSWFDELFEGGLPLPNQEDRPLTMLVAGPPGSGKTTLTMELCYRLARNEGNHNPQSLFSLYISTDQEADRMIENAEKYGYAEVRQHIVDYTVASNRPEVYDINRVAVWGKDQIRSKLEAKSRDDKLSLLADIVEGALQGVSAIFLNNALPESALQRISKKIRSTSKPDDSQEYKRIQPDILVIDSLNIVGENQREHFFEQFYSATSSGSKMVIFVLDSTNSGDTHEIWEYACDVVIRLDHKWIQDYYVRNIEVVKARYQSHIWGKHQLKIYKKFELPSPQAPDYDARLRRNQPYREEGGIFIYPSIHYYLSLYKRRGPTQEPSYATTRPQLTDVLEEGLPEGRCTAFIGSRGGHKSHLGYLHLLHRIINCQKNGEPEEAALVISLRDDEKMTWQTMEKIRTTEFRDANVTLENLQRMDRLEILYYHPGYITPEEFFHRMFISIQRLKRGNRKLTVLFNSVDQLGSRFPLCAKQEIFIPGIIEALSGEGATSIFIAVDEKGQPAEQYGLLPMADLILSFYPRRFKFNDYYGHLNEARKLDHKEGEVRERVDRIRNEFGNDAEVETIVLQVVRFAGGQQAGARGILELVDASNQSLYETPGLHFTKLSSKHNPGTPIYRNDGDHLQ